MTRRKIKLHAMKFIEHCKEHSQSSIDSQSEITKR